MNENRQLDAERPTAEVRVGSVTVLVRHAPVTVRIKSNGRNGTASSSENGQPQLKTYGSYQIIYYEGKRRQIKRHNTLAKATKRAKEIATRLSRLGPQADYLTEQTASFQWCGC